MKDDIITNPGLRYCFEQDEERFTNNVRFILAHLRLALMKLEEEARGFSRLALRLEVDAPWNAFRGEQSLAVSLGTHDAQGAFASHALGTYLLGPSNFETIKHVLALCAGVAEAETAPTVIAHHEACWELHLTLKQLEWLLDALFKAAHSSLKDITPGEYYHLGPNPSVA